MTDRAAERARDLEVATCTAQHEAHHDPLRLYCPECIVAALRAHAAEAVAAERARLSRFLWHRASCDAADVPAGEGNCTCGFREAMETDPIDQPSGPCATCQAVATLETELLSMLYQPNPQNPDVWYVAPGKGQEFSRFITTIRARKETG